MLNFYHTRLHLITPPKEEAERVVFIAIKMQQDL